MDTVKTIRKRVVSLTTGLLTLLLIIWLSNAGGAECQRSSDRNPQYFASATSLGRCRLS